MIVVTVEVWPKGNREKRRMIGVAEITHRDLIKSPSPDVCDYDVRIYKSMPFLERSVLWRQGVVKRFPRTILGHWDLLFRAMKSTIGHRNEVQS